MVEELLQPYKKLVDAKGDVIIGYTKTFMDYTNCFVVECNIGNFIADAMLWSVCTLHICKFIN